MNDAIYIITRKIGRALVPLDLSDRLRDLLSRSLITRLMVATWEIEGFTIAPYDSHWGFLSRSLSIRLISRWGALLNVVCFYLHSTPSGVGSRDLEIAPTKGWWAEDLYRTP